MMGEKVDRKTGAERSSFLTRSKFHLNFTGRKGLGRNGEGQGERRDRERGETKWIRRKDRRVSGKRETSKLWRQNGVWHRKERKKSYTGGG